MTYNQYLKELQSLCNLFNDQHPVGTKVIYWSKVGPRVIGETKSKAYVTNGIPCVDVDDTTIALKNLDIA
jgi:hypothetical protein